MGKASDLAPGVGSDAALVDASCKDFEGENHFISDGDETGEADDTTGSV